MANALTRALLVVLAVGQTACTTLTYVTQAAVGQERLEMSARDIDELVRDRRVDARTRGLLVELPRVKRFAEAHGLAATTNYTQYARVDGPAIVWVVSASEPLRFRSKTWSFPLVGSFTYLGWFDRHQADLFGADLRREGWDVDVRGSGAYSTEGYFKDPVLSTMISPGKDALGELANVILHESAHATFFVHNQSTLNESVAQFVGDGLAAQYVSEMRGPESDELRAYRASSVRAERRKQLMRAAYLTLDAVYESKVDDAAKLATKREVIARLQKDTGIIRGITNATLIQYRTYDSGQDALHALLETCGSDWPRFIRTLKRLESGNLGHEAQVADVTDLVLPLVRAGCAP